MELSEFVDKLAGLDTGPVSFAVTNPNQVELGSFTVRMRGLYQTKEHEIEIEGTSPSDALLNAFNLPEHAIPTDALLIWDDADRLAVADYDTHHLLFPDRPSHIDLELQGTKLVPKPFASNPTHGLGFHAYYEAAGGYTASELAVVGSLGWISSNSNFTVEIKTSTFHPRSLRSSDNRYAGRITTSTQSVDIGAIAKWLARSAEPDAIDDWLDSKGLMRGFRYEHDRCLIYPKHTGHAKPVYVGDYGIECVSCREHGRFYSGSRRPGWIAYPQLIGGSDPRIYTMVKNFTHWEHVKRIIPHITLLKNEEFLKMCYKVLLKTVHGKNDPRIDAVFSTQKIVRINRIWYYNDGDSEVGHHSLAGALTELPAVMKVSQKDSGEEVVKTDLPKISKFRSPGSDLSSHGYYDLMPINGISMYRFLTYPDGKYPFVVQSIRGLNSDRTPRFLDSKDRLKIDEARAIVEKLCPGADWRYIELQLVAMGFAEGNEHIPMIFTAGKSMSGKSTMPLLAAAIAGKLASAVHYAADQGRYRQMVSDEAATSDNIVTSEIFKWADMAGISHRQALDICLDLTPGSKGWKIFIGGRSIGRGFVFNQNDINASNEVQVDVQLGRRLVYARLNEKLPDWIPRFSAEGIHSISLLRNHSVTMAHACDSIVSHVIEKYFSGYNSFTMMAESLGYCLLKDSTDFEDRNKLLRKFFDAVCTAPPITGSLAKRFTGHGWKLINRELKEGDELSELWLDYCDTGHKGWFESRRLKAEDWSFVLSIKDTAIRPEVEVLKVNEKSLVVRFKNGTGRETNLTNGQLIATLVTQHG